MITKFEFTAREKNAIGIVENHVKYIRADNRENAVLRLYDEFELISIRDEFSIDDISWTKVNHDINGNPRYVCHFTQIIQDYYYANDKGRELDIDDKYKIALSRAKKFGGRKFHNKQYGGGIIFCTYSLREVENCILDVVQKNK